MKKEVLSDVATLAAPQLERTHCTRCNGSGTRGGFACMTCEGDGAALTKRGQAARAYMRSLLVKRAQEVTVGDVIHFTVGHLKIASRVNRIDILAGANIRVRLHGVRKKTGDDIAICLPIGRPVSMAYTVTELQVIRAKVEAYQAGLTKTGEVSRKPRITAQAA